MTIANTTRTQSFTGIGSVKDYDITFAFLDDSHIKATKISDLGVVTPLTIVTDYTLEGAGNMNGGQIHLVSNLELNYTLRVDRIVPLSQLTDVRNLGAWYPDIMETVFDLLTMLSIQEPSGPVYTTTTRPAASAAYDGRNIIIRDPGAEDVRQVCLWTGAAWAWKTYTLT